MSGFDRMKSFKNPIQMRVRPKQRSRRMNLKSNLVYQIVLIFFIFCFSNISLLASESNESPQTHGMKFLGQLNQYSSALYSALWGYTAPDGREYALLGVRTGTSIIDITDAPILKEVAFIPNKKAIWREIKTYSHYAYVVTDHQNTGLEIIDLSDLPRSAKLVTTFKNYPMSHTLAVDESQKLLFLMGGTGETVVVLSLINPLEPEEITRFGSSYVHDAFFKNGKAYLSEIVSQSFSIWDISQINHTNSSPPKLLKRLRDPNAPNVSFHNSWTTEDDRYLITTEEADNRTVKFWNIEDVTQPKLVSEWLPPNKIAHNVQVKGRFAYFSSYGGGIRILDISNPLIPLEVAYWTRSSNLEKGMVGMWACYPYFKSGKIIGSDIDQGLIVTEFEGAKE